MHYSLEEFEFRPDLTNDYRVSCPWVSEELFFCCFVFTFSRLLLRRYLFKLACNEDIHISLNEFKFQLDWTTDCGVSCPLASKKSL